MGTSPKAKIRLRDLHSAIETLAVAQAEIGIAVLQLLRAVDSPLDKVKSEELFKSVDAAVDDLQSLASEFLDIPYDR